MLEGSSFETAEELQAKITDILMSIPTSTFRAAFEERKVDCCDALKQAACILKNTPSQRYAYITRGDNPCDGTFRTPILCEMQ
jgi:hypothetical protein